LLATSAGTAFAIAFDTPPDSPRDVPFYEIDRLRSLTLPEMNWIELDRLNDNGVTVITGTFSAFDWNTYDINNKPITLPWLQRAVLFLPPNYPDNTNPDDRAATRAVLYNSHDVNPASGQFYRVWGVELARNFNIPVMLHGWDPALTLPAGYESVHEMQFPLLQRFLQRGFCNWGDVPIDGSYAANGNILVKGDMLAITLLQRLAEQQGGTVNTVGSLGISKEGNSHWTLAAIDDRIEVIAPGGHYAENFNNLVKSYYTEWGAKDRFQSVTGVNFTNLFLRLGNWYQSTELGQILDRISNVSNFKDQIYARTIIISGDVTLLTQHDKAFPLGAETPFLDNFNEKPWQYVRVPDGSGVMLDSNMSARAASLLPMVADKLLKPDAPYPKIKTVTYETSNDRRFRIHTTMQNSKLPGLSLSLWVATSKNRWWTEVVQGNWLEAPLHHDKKTGQWLSDWSDQIPEDEAVAFFIEAKNKGTYKNYWFYRIDTSQPQFIWPRPSPDPHTRIIWGHCK